MNYKLIIISYGDNTQHSIDNLTALDLIAWLMGYLRTDVIRKGPTTAAITIKAVTIERKNMFGKGG